MIARSCRFTNFSEARRNEPGSFKRNSPQQTRHFPEVDFGFRVKGVVSTLQVGPSGLSGRRGRTRSAARYSAQGFRRRHRRDARASARAVQEQPHHRAPLSPRAYPLRPRHHRGSDVSAAMPRIRAAPKPTTQGRILRDNTFGDIEEDAIRRDFTANALYYDIPRLQRARLRRRHAGYRGTPAAPDRRRHDVRYQEDPVRMLRAVRFAAKLDFEIEASAAEAIHEYGHLLAVIPPARMFDEVIKLFHSGMRVRVFAVARIPAAQVPGAGAGRMAAGRTFGNDARFSRPGAGTNTDNRVNTGQPVSPGFIFAVLLWPVVQQQANRMQSDRKAHDPGAGPGRRNRDEAPGAAHFHSAPLQPDGARYLELAAALPPHPGQAAAAPARFPVFRAAYDFMCIQAMVGLFPYKLSRWWTEYQQNNPPNRHRTRNAGPTATPEAACRGAIAPSRRRWLNGQCPD